jgi:hypothetical protein
MSFTNFCALHQRCFSAAGAAAAAALLSHACCACAFACAQERHELYECLCSARLLLHCCCFAESCLLWFWC